MLPYVDEHALTIGAPPERVWAALGSVLGPSGSALPAVAGRLLEARPRRPEGSPLTAGGAITGFRVVRARAPSELALEGEHRFSHYALTFRLDPLPGGRTRLTAETRAAFPGAAGRAYRALVIGSRGHVLAVRRMLRGVARKAVAADNAG